MQHYAWFLGDVKYMLTKLTLLTVWVWWMLVLVLSNTRLFSIKLWHCDITLFRNENPLFTSNIHYVGISHKCANVYTYMTAQVSVKFQPEF